LISQAQISSTAYWLNRFHDTLTANVPLRLHLRSLGDDGNPDLHPEFLHWLDGTNGRHDGLEDRAKLRRAMKRLRERSLREWEVMHRVMELGEPVPQTTAWLNDRSMTGGHSDRYSQADTLVILYAAVDKVCEFWA
jgi:hypothetical protein